jgi:hypothetical protein
VKRDDCSAAEDAGRFQITRWSAVLVVAWGSGGRCANDVCLSVQTLLVPAVCVCGATGTLITGDVNGV